MLFKTQSRHLFRIPRQFFRTVMVSITFYDSVRHFINVLDNPWQKHLTRNQIMEK